MLQLDGLLFFPVTPFAADGSLDGDRLRAHIAERMHEGVGGIFAACGTGEFSALRTEELLEVAAVAVEVAAGRVPVVIGIGGGSASSRRTLADLERLGVDGLLLLPPYLVTGDQDGLYRYVETVADATRLDIIVYQRGSMVFTPATARRLSSIPNVVGLKDGVGDLAQMQAIVSVIRATGDDEFLFFNGLPTAEITMRAYRAIGVPMYSSAVFAFAPDIALAFYEAFQVDDQRTVEILLAEFFIPFIEIRDRAPGYHVSLVKSAVRADGAAVGPVRAPLSAPTERDQEDLALLLTRARDRVAQVRHDLRDAAGSRFERAKV